MRRSPGRSARRRRPALARWRALRDASDRALAEHLAETALALRERRGELSHWATLADLPEGEVVASPFGARMIALGLAAGATGVHHELRPLLTWDRALLPGDAVTDPLHGLWHRGALRTGKYQEFQQEEPFCAYHPEHSSKWAPHEHLHRAVGFLHDGAASGFERYLGARLNELLPVASWYGVEEALRLDHDGPFDRVRESREPGASVARARWLGDPERSLRARARDAVPLLRWTLERAAAELDAIDRELETGAVVPSRDAGAESFAGVRLDASSDALAYVHAHAARLDAPSVARVLEGLAANRVRDVRSLRARVDRTLDALLLSPLRLAPRDVERRILASVLHDVFLRAATRGDATFRACAPLLPAAERLSRSLGKPAGREADVEPVRALVAEVRARISRAVGRREADAVTTLGLRGSLRSVSEDALVRGLRATVPTTSSRLTTRQRRALVRSLATDVTSSRTLLAERVAHVLRGLAELPESARLALSELARLEAALALAGGHDPRAAWSIPLRGAPRGSRLARDARASILHFETDVLGAHRGEPLLERAVSIVIARIDDELLLVEIPRSIALRLEPLCDAPDPLARLVRKLGAAPVKELVALGVLLVLPPVPRR